MPKKLEWEEIIERSNTKHNNKYEYEFKIHKNGRDKINIICPNHGLFQQTIESHLSGKGCPQCAGNVKYTVQTISSKLFKIYPYYEYDFTGFENNESIINIKCQKHGWFKMKASNHLHGQKCKKCSKIVYSNETFIKICSERHFNLYDYSLTHYESCKSIIKIICPTHGVFKQNARTHFRGSGCPKCELPKGEIKIKGILEKNHIKFEQQKRFDACKYKKELPFDFYLTDYNTCIEYDGQQHFFPVKYWGGVKNFENQKIKDEIKNNFCYSENIKLFRITYKDNVEEKLLEIINGL